MDKPGGSSNDHLLEHSYDGIQEYDNPMPRWWVYIFVATMVFAVIYALNIGGIGTGAGRIADYNAEMAAARARQPQDAGGPVDEAALVRSLADPAARVRGKTVFTTNCVSCHRPDGGGLIGPNLTDNYWLHGGTPVEIHRTVDQGVLAKGMPAWGKVLPPNQVRDVAAYVISLHGTNPPNPKPPQGALVP